MKGPGKSSPAEQWWLLQWGQQIYLGAVQEVQIPKPHSTPTDRVAGGGELRRHHRAGFWDQRDQKHCFRQIGSGPEADGKAAAETGSSCRRQQDTEEEAIQDPFPNNNGQQDLGFDYRKDESKGNDG